MSINFVRWHKHENLEKIADKIHEHIGYNIPVDIDYVFVTKRRFKEKGDKML